MYQEAVKKIGQGLGFFSPLKKGFFPQPLGVFSKLWMMGELIHNLGCMLYDISNEMNITYNKPPIIHKSGKLSTILEKRYTLRKKVSLTPKKVKM